MARGGGSRLGLDLVVVGDGAGGAIEGVLLLLAPLLEERHVVLERGDAHRQCSQSMSCSIQSSIPACPSDEQCPKTLFLQRRYLSTHEQRGATSGAEDYLATNRRLVRNGDSRWHTTESQASIPSPVSPDWAAMAAYSARISSDLRGRHWPGARRWSPDRPEAGPDQPTDGVADGLAHPPHLAVATLVDHDLERRAGRASTGRDGPGRGRCGRRRGRRRPGGARSAALSGTPLTSAR